MRVGCRKSLSKMRPWLLAALLAAAAADIVGVEPESFDRRAQLRGDDEELERDKVQTYEDEQVLQPGSRTSKASEKAATHFTAPPCPRSITTSPENFRALIALRAATLTTLHVGAMRAMWCASVRRTTMCSTTSVGRSVRSVAGSMLRDLARDERRRPST